MKKRNLVRGIIMGATDSPYTTMESLDVVMPVSISVLELLCVDLTDIENPVEFKITNPMNPEIAAYELVAVEEPEVPEV